MPSRGRNARRRKNQAMRKEQERQEKMSNFDKFKESLDAKIAEDRENGIGTVKFKKTELVECFLKRNLAEIPRQ